MPPSQSKVRRSSKGRAASSDAERRPHRLGSQAWYHGLKGKSARAAEMGGPRLDVECLAFPGEGHALDGVVAELACFEATLEWFERYAGDD